MSNDPSVRNSNNGIPSPKRNGRASSKQPKSTKNSELPVTTTGGAAAYRIHNNPLSNSVNYQDTSKQGGEKDEVSSQGPQRRLNTSQ